MNSSNRDLTDRSVASDSLSTMQNAKAIVKSLGEAMEKHERDSLNRGIKLGEERARQHFAPIIAQLEARVAQVEADAEARVAQVGADAEARVAQVGADAEARVAQVTT
ncbi:hypothetical protein IL306_004340, partial [Fusarium sp. DS 682]